ncbi:MAG: hypothetical protein KDJ45_16285 [Hyphomicrobiaceae bacterium]|nr:hypothetical protein [Hyphomicrobiaceae bacterium]MCC0010160.1 hypothetical protein [Hyphomicrobiaceae bacterium]
MSPRAIAIVLIVVALLLLLSWGARIYVAHMRCDGLGMIYEAGKGCIEPSRPPAIILERGLKRT